MAVVGKTADEVAARAKAYSELAHAQMWLPEFVSLNMVFHDGTENILSEVYFSLSEAYKKPRLKPGSRTEWTKAAAFSAIAVGIVNPLRKINLNDADPLWAIVNPMFAMTCAYGHCRNMFGAKPFDERHRIYRALTSLAFPSVEPILEEGNHTGGNFVSKWDLTLSDEERASMDLWVAYFVSLLENEKLLLAAGKAAAVA